MRPCNTEVSAFLKIAENLSTRYITAGRDGFVKAPKCASCREEVAKLVAACKSSSVGMLQSQSPQWQRTHTCNVKAQSVNCLRKPRCRSGTPTLPCTKRLMSSSWLVQTFRAVREPGRGWRFQCCPLSRLAQVGQTSSWLSACCWMQKQGPPHASVSADHHTSYVTEAHCCTSGQGPES